MHSRIVKGVLHKYSKAFHEFIFCFYDLFMLDCFLDLFKYIGTDLEKVGSICFNHIFEGPIGLLLWESLSKAIKIKIIKYNIYFL